MIKKIDRKKMVDDAYNSGNYEKSIQREIFRKLDEIVEALNKLQGSMNE